MLGIVDAVIIVIIMSGAAYGFKNGFFKQTVFLIGTLICFILAYYLKDYLANFLSFNLPFLGVNGLVSLNILIYQAISFFIILGLLGFLFGFILKAVNLFENILKATVILSIPSKILGLVVGLIEGYIIAFILVFLVKQPYVNLDIVHESKLADVIVNSSPGLSNIVNKSNDTAIEIYDLTFQYNETKDKDKFNRDSIDIMLNNGVITVSYMDKLIETNKININGIDDVLNKYR